MKATFPRIYLDANVLVSALMESESEWLREHPQEPKALALIKSSRELYDKRESIKLMVSVFSIAEFIAQGRQEKFGHKSVDEML